MFLSEGLVFYSNRAHNKRERERNIKEKERHTKCVVWYLSIKFLPEENKEESEKRFNIPIICRSQKKKKKRKDD
jgi:hypothetical protein